MSAVFPAPSSISSSASRNASSCCGLQLGRPLHAPARPGALWPPDGACSARVNVAFVIDTAVLVQHAGGAGQAQRGQAIVLRHHDIARLKQIDQPKVRAVRAAGDGDGARTLARISCASSHTSSTSTRAPCHAQGDLHHRAGVRVYQQARARSLGRHLQKHGVMIAVLKIQIHSLDKVDLQVIGYNEPVDTYSCAIFPGRRRMACPAGGRWAWRRQKHS